MIRISIEVDSGDARFRAAVRAESIERAMGLASARYPGTEVRVLFPIDPDSFFCREGAVLEAAEPIRPEVPAAG